MKNVSRITWGIVLVTVGALFALNALSITDIDVFFDGWWTLFIIVPCAIGLFTDYDKTGHLIGICIGAHAAATSPLSSCGAMALAADSGLPQVSEKDRSNMFAKLFYMSIGGVLFVTVLGCLGLYGIL